MIFTHGTTLFIKGKNFKIIKYEIESQAKNLYKWFMSNKLTLKVDKN